MLLSKFPNGLLDNLPLYNKKGIDTGKKVFLKDRKFRSSQNRIGKRSKILNVKLKKIKTHGLQNYFLVALIFSVKSEY